MVVVLLLVAAGLSGCHKSRTLANFPLRPGVTAQQVEDEMGSPTKDSANWLAYTMSDGSELRLYFLEGQRGTTRTLSQADLYVGAGPSLQVTNVFKLPAKPKLAPATNSATEPTTRP
jgi:hypothetical protein